MLQRTQRNRYSKNTKRKNWIHTDSSAFDLFISSVRSMRLRRAFLSSAYQEAPAASEGAVRRRGRGYAKP